MTLEIEGFEELERTLTRIGKNVTAQAERGLGDQSAKILEASNRLVPVDTGELKDSGSVTKVERRGDVIEATVEYTADHAAPVHENLDARHPAGQAKFLQEPFLQTTLKDFAKGIDLKKAAR